MCMLEISDSINVNRKFVRLTSPMIALYFAELIVILKEVKRKAKYDSTTGYWKLNRAFVKEELGIEVADQRLADQALVKLGIVDLNPDNNDKLRIDMKKYYELLSEEVMVDVLPKSVKLTAEEKKLAKRTGIIDRIVGLFGYEDEKSVEAVRKLADVYYDKGQQKNSQWEPIVQMLHACTTDPEGLVEIIDYVLSTNYVSIPAAIDSFMKKHAPTATKLNTEQKKCSGTMSGVEF